MLRVKVPAGSSRRRSCAPSARSRTATAAATASCRPGRTSSCTGSSWRSCPDVFAHLEAPGSRPPAAAATPSATSPAARCRASRTTSSSTAPRSSTRRPSTSTATPTSPTCRGSTSTRSPPAPTAATRRRSTASRSSARSTTAARASRVRVGGGLSSVPRIAQRHRRLRRRRRRRSRSLRAITGVWSDDLRYRVSRVKARLKFMVDDIGPEGMRERVEERLGRALEDFALPPVAASRRNHLGVHPQKQDGLSYVGVPVHLGLDLRRPDDRDRRAGRADRRRRPPDAPAELHRHRRPRRPVDEASPSSSGSASRSTSTAVRGNSIACTGEPHCNFSVAETKTRLGRADRPARGALRRRRSPSCGSTSTAARTPAPSTGSATSASRARPRATTGGVRRQAYDIFVRGGLGPDAAIGRPLFRRVPTDELDAPSTGWSPAGSPARGDGESVHGRSRGGSTDDELGALAGLEPAQARVRRGGGGMSSVELIDELEAGELSVEFEGEEPEIVLEWAIERFCAAHRDLDRVPDRRHRADRHGVRDRSRRSQVFSVDTGRLPDETLRADRARCASAIPGCSSSCSRRTRDEVASDGRQARRRTSSTRSVENRLLCCNVRKVRPLTRHLALARRVDHGPPPRPVGEPHEHPQGRDRPRPRRDRQAQPARRVD